MSSTEPTKADRQAAWPHRPDCYKPSDYDRWVNGVYDNVDAIQALMRHRLASQQSNDELVEALVTIKGFAAHDENCHKYHWANIDPCTCGYSKIINHIDTLLAKHGDGK